jgi:hypothetical protein
MLTPKLFTKLSDLYGWDSGSEKNLFRIRNTKTKNSRAVESEKSGACAPSSGKISHHRVINRRRCAPHRPDAHRRNAATQIRHQLRRFRLRQICKAMTTSPIRARCFTCELWVRMGKVSSVEFIFLCVPM